MGRRRKYVSQPEIRLVRFLRRRFPKIRAQVRAHGQLVDAFIPELDMYVQLDGVFWHGLDESCEKTRIVIKKMKKDLTFNGFFDGAKTGSRLFRISDKQWIHAEHECLMDVVMEAMVRASPGLTLYDGPPGYRVL